MSLVGRVDTIDNGHTWSATWLDEGVWGSPCVCGPRSLPADEAGRRAPGVRPAAARLTATLSGADRYRAGGRMEQRPQPPSHDNAPPTAEQLAGFQRMLTNLVEKACAQGKRRLAQFYLG